MLADLAHVASGISAVKAGHFAGDHGLLRERYREGIEDQLGALGLVLNCVVLWNTIYMDKARAQRQAAGRPIPDEILAGLTPPDPRAPQLLRPLPIQRARPRPPATRPRRAGRRRELSHSARDLRITGVRSLSRSTFRVGAAAARGSLPSAADRQAAMDALEIED
jgi:hypothetical protein